VVDQGLSLQQFTRELIARMRDLLMLKLGLNEKVLGGDEEKKALAQRAQSFSEQDLIRYFDLLLRLEGDVRYSTQPRLHLEVGLVKLAKAGHMRDIEEVLRDLKQGGGTSTGSTPVAPSPRPKPAPPTPARVVPPAAAAATPAIPKIDIPRPKPAAPPTPAPTPAPTPKPAPEAPAPKPPASDIIKPAGPNAHERRAAQNSLLESAKQDDFVKKFVETFRGDILQVKPPKGEDDQ
jgi:DNA polymerase-3 subunit gamma/tau